MKNISTITIDDIEITLIEEKFKNSVGKFFFKGKEQIVVAADKRNIILQIGTILLERK